MNKLPFSAGDILFNSTSKKFIYVYESRLETDNETISYSFFVIGNPKLTMMDAGCEEELSLCMTRYGNINNIDMTLDDLKKFDISKGGVKDRGLRMSRFNRDIKMKFLSSY